MKIYVDTNKSYNDLIFLKAIEWKDFKTKEEKGTKIICGDLTSFEQIEVRVKDNKENILSQFKQNERIKFNNLLANYWQMNGKSGVVLSADEVLRVD